MTKGDTEKSSVPDAKAKEQLRRFRKAARDAGVDPELDIDEVMKRLASQKRGAAASKKPTR